MPLGERFLAFYDNNDGRFYEKSDLISNLWKYVMSGLEIASNRVHLGLLGSNSNFKEDKGLRRRISVMKVTKHQG